MRVLNLARHPFRNESGPALVFGLCATAVLIMTIWQLYALHRLLPGDGATTQHGEARALELELGDLRAEARRLTAERPDVARLGEWELVQDLVDRRTFPWTALLVELEDLLPRNVRLVSITPRFERGRAVLELQAIARTRSDGFEFVRMLHGSERFDDALALSIDPSQEGDDFSYSMVYLPEDWQPVVRP
jgi:type IV pilus assembly protein PilN